MVASWAYKMAVECPYIRADVIEAGEFVDLKGKYDVGQMPKVVLNEKVLYEGPWLAQAFLERIVELGVEDQGSGVRGTHSVPP